MQTTGHDWTAMSVQTFCRCEVAKFHRVCHSQGGSRLRCVRTHCKKSFDVSWYTRYTRFFFWNVPNILLVRNIIFPINMWQSREISYFQTHPESKIWVPRPGVSCRRQRPLDPMPNLPRTGSQCDGQKCVKNPKIRVNVSCDQLWSSLISCEPFAQHSCSVFRAAMRSPTWEAFMNGRQEAWIIFPCQRPLAMASCRPGHLLGYIFLYLHFSELQVQTFPFLNMDMWWYVQNRGSPQKSHLNIRSSSFHHVPKKKMPPIGQQGRVWWVQGPT